MDDLCESSDDSSMEDEIVETPNGSLQKVMKDFQDKLQAQYIENNSKSFIIINENSVVESLNLALQIPEGHFAKLHQLSGTKFIVMKNILQMGSLMLHKNRSC